MKKILLLGTGGTIASKQTEDGLQPALTAPEILEYVPGVERYCDIDVKQVCNIDSTNMSPEIWSQIVRAIEANYDHYNGFVITHGTDTMAYTSAALSYMIQNSRKPIVITGSQMPINTDSTDAKVNLRDSIYYACDDFSENVSLVFDGSVIAGTRAKKMMARSFNAFYSVNFPVLARIQDEHIIRYLPYDPIREPLRFQRQVSDSICVMKLIPGSRPELLAYLFEHYDCIVIESFGVGGIPQRLMDAFAGHELHFITGHTHVNSNYDIREGVVEHNVAQICGNLWYDPINKDGTPKGYQLFRECGGEFSWEYRSLGSPAVRQLRVWQPGQVEAFPGSVVAKIWNWDPCWTVVWYEDGRCGPKDAAQALAWYKKAAEAGHDRARKAVERMEKLV